MRQKLVDDDAYHTNSESNSNGQQWIMGILEYGMREIKGISIWKKHKSQ